MLEKCYVVRCHSSAQCFNVVAKITNNYSHDISHPYNYVVVDSNLKTGYSLYYHLPSNYINKPSYNFYDWYDKFLNQKENMNIEKLPQRYVVECNNREQTNSVANTCNLLNKKNYSLSYWRYVIVDKERCSNEGIGIEYNKSDISYYNYEIIPYNVWERLFGIYNAYKLKDTNKRDIINNILSSNNIKYSWGFIDNFCKDIALFNKNSSDAIKFLKENDLLDIWFEVYYIKPKEYIVINNTKLLFKANKIFHNDTEIPVEEIKNLNKILVQTQNIGEWECSVETIKIGCKSGWTLEHIEEILKFYDEKNN